MANYNGRDSKSSIITAIAVILALLLIASVTLGLGAHFGGWFDGEEDVDTDTSISSVLTDDTSTEESDSDVVISDSTTSGEDSGSTETE